MWAARGTNVISRVLAAEGSRKYPVHRDGVKGQQFGAAVKAALRVGAVAERLKQEALAPSAVLGTSTGIGV